MTKYSRQGVTIEYPSERWEYMTEAVGIGPLSPKQLNDINDLGKDGWEAVSINHHFILFKRLLPPEGWTDIPHDE